MYSSRQYLLSQLRPSQRRFSQGEESSSRDLFHSLETIYHHHSIHNTPLNSELTTLFRHNSMTYFNKLPEEYLFASIPFANYTQRISDPLDLLLTGHIK